MNLTPAKTLVVALLALLPVLANAQLTANIGVTSNYKFRGQDQDTSKNKAFKPALQGGLDYAFGESGWYIGNWNSSVDWLPRNKVEVDLYGGYKFKAAGADMDVGVLTYIYPRNTLGNTTELYYAATVGPLTAKYSHAISEDYFGFADTKFNSRFKGRNSGYLNLALAQEIAPKTTLKASVGYTRFSSDIAAPNYVDYSVGAAYDLGTGFSVSGAVAGANKRAFYGDINKARLIVSLNKTFP